MKIRITRFVPQFRIVRDLHPGEVVDLAPEIAAQFINNEMGVPADEEEIQEAAALKQARRRG